jgi:hypothetical protein
MGVWRRHALRDAPAAIQEYEADYKRPVDLPETGGQAGDASPRSMASGLSGPSAINSNSIIPATPGGSFSRIVCLGLTCRVHDANHPEAIGL